MREELKDFTVEQVSGGKVYVNGNTKKLAFDTIPGAFSFTCEPYDILKECDKLIGKYRTNAEYDQACYNMLHDKGWI